MKNKGILLIISGPSGSGKGTAVDEMLRLCKAMPQHYPSLFLSVSATTRSPRPGETEGKHYFFYSKPQFQDEIVRGNMLEYTEYCDNFYGTPRAPVEKALDEGRDIILEIECDGCFQVKEKMPNAISIFVVAPSIEELRRRLTGRGTETAEVIEKRLKKAEFEYTMENRYDYRVVNRTPNQAAEEILNIINLEREKRNGNE